MEALPCASASPPTNSVCTGSSRPPPPGSILRSRYSSTTCQPSSGRLLLPKVSGPISHPTRAACARSTSSPPESRRVGFGHTTLPTSVGSSESVVRAASAMVFVPFPATDAACRAQVSWHGPRRSSGTGREPSGARSPCRKRIRLRDTAKEPSRTTTSSTVARPCFRRSQTCRTTPAWLPSPRHIIERGL
jgi:hypothetical protein